MRYKEYNVNRVLEQSLKLFWDTGFRGCSINDIVNITGVNRFSLYHEFQNKEGILYGSMKLYRERYCQQKFEILDQQGDVRELLKLFYLSFLDNPKILPGCYIIHIGTELADSDDNIRTLLDSFLSEIESLFVNLLTRHNYSLLNAKVLSTHLVGLYCTAMSFCLIHTKSQREKHVENGINVILT